MADNVKRFQVFVSSTYLDLKEERQAVTAALLECDAFPSGMELFPAADDDAWTLIKKVIDECDYYLLVIGGKYGSIDPVDQLSYTEKEFDYAVAQGKPVMAFLHGSPGSLTADQSEMSEGPQVKLETFRTKVKTTKHVKYWTTAEGLAGQVALTFNKFVRLYPAVGWIRADQATSTQSLQALADARTKIDELEARLNSARTSPPPGSEGLAHGDDKFVLPTFIQGTYRLPGGPTKAANAWLHEETTWDTVFSILCPRLLQDCEEAQLRQALQDQLAGDWYAEAENAIRDQVKGLGDDPSKARIGVTSLAVDDEDFGTIMVQLSAVGLIEPSHRKRSVTQVGSYWALTPYGQTRTVQLRARRTDQPLARSGDQPSIGG
ncbi:MAG TPA: DUF4062 domain-containing protein [Acidothermaceae bacterium]|nr:DUF4062 domain-containing protein [Acidothermaceae bacterium]